METETEHIQYPPGWDANWPGKVLRCSYCQGQFFQIGRIVEQADDTICEECYQKLGTCEDPTIQTTMRMVVEDLREDPTGG